MHTRNGAKSNNEAEHEGCNRCSNSARFSHMRQNISCVFSNGTINEKEIIKCLDFYYNFLLTHAPIVYFSKVD